MNSILSNPKRRPMAITIVSIIIFIVFGNIFSTPKSLSTKRKAEEKITVEINSNLERPEAILPSTNVLKPLVYASGYILIDHDSKYPLLSKNPDLPVAVASTTKIMTALLALEMLQPNQIITVSKEANATEGSKVDFFTGETVYVRDVLSALMLDSANNAAMMLAGATGSVDQFVANMNKRALELGLRNTNYKDPAGLNDEGRSTPRDLALLLDYALDNPDFRTLVTKPVAIFSSADGAYKHEVKSSNRLIQNEEPLFFAETIGGKTGFTFEAGHCLIVSAQFGQKRYTASILRTNADTNDASAQEARKLLEWAQKLN